MALTQVPSGMLSPDLQATPFGFKNRIINGKMEIDQRNSGVLITPVDQQMTVDRWLYRASSTGKVNIQRNLGSVTPPSGFQNYLGAVVTTAIPSLASSDYYFISQLIEANNMQDFQWGTSNAQPVTVSFWVRASSAGTYGGALRSTYNQTFTYTVNSANTWEYKTVTVQGAGVGTTWGTGSSVYVELNFVLGVGSNYQYAPGSWVNSNTVNAINAPGTVNVLASVGSYLYVTGVQVEKGSTATAFEYRDITREMQLCQRYYWTNSGETLSVPYVSNAAPVSTSCYAWWVLPVAMRTAPTCTFSTNGNISPINTRMSNGMQIAMLGSHTGSGGAGYINSTIANAEF